MTKASRGASNEKIALHHPSPITETKKPHVAVSAATGPVIAQLLIPWDVLVSDNERTTMRGPVPVRSKAYVRGKRWIVGHGRSIMGAEPPIEEPVHVEMRFFPPDARSRDPQNLVKQVLDGIKGVLVADDDWKHVRSWRGVTVEVDRDEPRLELEIREFGG